jgi:hypothetical protein
MEKLFTAGLPQYRIEKVTHGDNVNYYAQTKWGKNWITLDDMSRTLEAAQKLIDEMVKQDAITSTTEIIEYPKKQILEG